MHWALGPDQILVWPHSSLYWFPKSTTAPSIHGLKCGIASFIRMFQMQGFPHQLWRLNSPLLHAFPLVTQPVFGFGSGPLLFACCPPVSGFPEGRRPLVRAPVLTRDGERDIRSRHVWDVQGMPSSEEAEEKLLRPGAGPVLSQGN